MIENEEDLGVAPSSGSRATGLRPQPPSASSQSSVPNAVARLENYLIGLEIAADCERRIFQAYAPEWEEWEARPAVPVTDKLTRMMRNALDARSNADRIEKDAAAIRTVLEALAKARGEQS